VLDAYRAAGGNFVDTADSYSSWVSGNFGGESEEIIGTWIQRRRNRDDLVVATKVGMAPRNRGLSEPVIKRCVEGSLRRLRTDYIDLYYAHVDDPASPLEETLGALSGLVRAGKVRYIAASNYGVERLRDALSTSDRDGFETFCAVQVNYSLVERGYEAELRELCAATGMGCFPYRALAKGFLSGKYRTPQSLPLSAHVDAAAKYLTPRGTVLLGALDEIAARHDVPVAAVSLAWLRAQPTVVAPVASARTVAQLHDLIESVELELDSEELARLDRVAVVG
jgi:aryl-alcohol dehydrogenase (NADP+)